jgi:hypothetical protein
LSSALAAAGERWRYLHMRSHEMRTQAVVVVAAATCLATALSGAHAADLAIEGLRQTYATVSDVRITIRNATRLPISLDSFQPDLLIVERQVDGGSTWVRGAAWQCTNAGNGSPRSVPPAGTVEVPLLKSWAFRPSGHPEYFEPEIGGRLPLRGRYRVTVRYSFETWSSIAHIPKVVKSVVSTVFEVE